MHLVGRPPCRETVVGWDKFWLGQCPSVLNESPDGDIIFMNDDLTTMRSKLVYELKRDGSVTTVWTMNEKLRSCASRKKTAKK